MIGGIQVYNLKPVFYDDFECLGDKCLYTCCGGWGIPFTPEMRDKYLALNSKEVLVTEDVFVKSTTHENYFIKFNKKRMCPLCNERQLCSLVIKYGPDVLDGICKDFPRVNTVSGTMDEAYLSLACPHVIELLCKDPTVLSFILEKDSRPFPTYLPEDEKYVLLDMQIRDRILDFLQDRTLPLNLRIFYVAYTLEKVTIMKNKEAEYIAAELDRLFDENMIASFKETFDSITNDNKKMQYQVFKMLLNKISSKMSVLVFDDNFSTKSWVDEILGKNNTCTYEERISAYAEWIKYDSERYHIMIEKVLTYNWMMFSLHGISENYFWDNYLISLYEIFVIKQIHILYYMIHREISKEISYVLAAIVERCTNHGMKDILSMLHSWKERGMISVDKIGVLCL